MENITLQKDLGYMDDYLLQKKIEIMIDLSHKKIKSELDSIKSMICKLDETINEIKRCLSTANIRTEFKAAPASDKTAREGSSQEEAKPSYGDHKPEDVSIEKFFYFGNKGR